MTLLLPPDTVQMQKGDPTGVVLIIQEDGSVLPGSYDFPLIGATVTVGGPNNLPAGSYDVVCCGGDRKKVGSLFLRIGLFPGDPSMRDMGSEGYGTLTTMPDTWLSPGRYDIVQ